ncbi:MAG: hypothetical protein DRI86_13025, partial [Bacteroidetes bacterium]
KGLEGDTILFTSLNTTTGWDGVQIDAPVSYRNDSSIFDYCRFEYAKRVPTDSYLAGGAISSKSNYELRVSNCLFENNEATGSYGNAAGISLSSCNNSEIRNNIFKNNTGNRSIVFSAYTTYNFKSNKMYNNTVTDGYAFNSFGSGGYYNNNIIANNTTTGGAVYLGYASSRETHFSNNIIVNNIGERTGGLFIDNIKPDIYNNTIVNNVSTNATYAGGIYFNANADANLRNNIIYGNEIPGGISVQIYINSIAGDPKFYNNDIEGDILLFRGNGAGINYTGVYVDNVDIDPSFETPSADVGVNFDGINANWALATGSAIINRGYSNSDNLDLPSIDYNNNTRIYNGRIDIGAIENMESIVSPCTISDDTQWEADTIKITCDVTIQSTKKLTIKAGTIILFMDHYEINVEGSIVAQGTADDNIRFISNDTTGFSDSTITAGGWNGINFSSILPSINDSSIFSYCSFSYAKTGNPSSSSLKNGAVFNIYNTPDISIQNCIFNNNMANRYGGALYIESSNIVFNNNIVSNNNAGYYGGGIYVYDCNTNFYNNTIVNNKARNYGGLYVSSSEIIIKNSIFWGNYQWGTSSTYGTQIMLSNSNSSMIYNSDFQYGISKIGGGYYNLALTQDIYNLDPQFINPTLGVGWTYDGSESDWDISTNSPLLNKGINTTSMTAQDFAGNNRLVSDTIDVGAFEVQISSRFIDIQPSDESVCVGFSSSFAAHASVEAQYQWQKDGNNIAGATNYILNNNNIALSDTGEYNCIISNAFGTISTDTVNLSAMVSPTIISSPQSTNECFGSSVTFSAEAGGTTPIEYQWYNTNSSLQSSGGNSSAQPFEIGDDSVRNTANAYPSPFANYYHGAKHQFLILASELTAMDIVAGDITTLGFDVFALNACPSLSNFEIKIGPTNTTSFSTSWETGLTSVYSVASYQPTAGWNNFGFINAFNWDGSSNIVIEICSNNSSWINSGNATVNQSNTAFNSSLYYKADNNTVCINPGNGIASSKRPNIRLVAQGLSVSNTSTYSINSISANDASNYYMVATNTCGIAQSTGAILGVNYAPTLTSISSVDDICEDASYTYSTTTSQGTSPMTYQWFHGGDTIVAANSLSYNITNSDTSNAGLYLCKATNMCGTDSTNISVLTVNEKPEITSQSSSQTVCENQSITMYISSTGTAPLTYQWYEGANPIVGATNNSYTINTVSTSDASTYYCKVSNGCTSTPVASTGIVLTVDEAPSISSQTSTIEICEGTPANFSTTANGTAPLSYQWYDASGSIALATNNTYDISSTGTGDAGNYYCIITNTCGSENSIPIPLTINTVPSIISQPSDATKCENQSSMFDVQANGTATLNYQWYKGGSQISGATASSLLISPITTNDDANYYCKITNLCGNISSNTIALTVNTNVNITAQSNSQTFCEGTSPSFSITTTGTNPITYQWYNEDGAIAGEVNNSYNIASLDTADEGAYYSIATNICSSSYSNNIILGVNQAPNIVNAPASSTVCENLSAVFNVSSEGTSPITYQWYDDNGAITGATNGSYIIPQANTADIGSYYVKASNICGNANSNNAQLTVNTGVSIDSQTASAVKCDGDGVSFSISADGTSPISYQWYKNNTALSSAGNNLLLLSNVDTSDVADYYVIASNNCNSAQSNLMSLTVNQSPSITAQPNNATVCDGNSTQLNVGVIGTGPLTYQWYKTNSAISNANSAMYLVSQATTTDSTYYHVKITNSCGDIISNSVDIVVNTSPSILSQSSDLNQCEGTQALFNITTEGTAPLSYQWYNDDGLISGANANSYSIPLISDTDASDYFCEVSNSCGSDISSDKTLSVKVSPTLVSQSVDTTICEGLSTMLQVGVTGTEPITYQWYKSSNIISGGVSSSYNLPYISINDAAIYHAVATNDCGSDQTADIDLSVNELVSINTQSSDSSRCENEGMTFEVASGGSGPLTYQWYKGSTAIAGAQSELYNLPSVVLSDAGLYHVVVSNMCNIILSNNKNLIVNENPEVSLGNDTSFCDGGSVTLSAGYGMQSMWSNGSFNNQINVTSTGSYFVNVTDQNGCSGISDTINVSVVYPYASQSICVIGVDTATNKNIIVWDKPNVGNIASFNLYKESAVSNVWNLIGIM